MAHKPIKRCSVSLIIRKLQIKLHQDTLSHLSDWKQSKHWTAPVSRAWTCLVGIKDGTTLMATSTANVILQYRANYICIYLLTHKSHF